MHEWQRYQQEFREASLKYDCATPVYVPMTKHLHLLLTPASVGALSRLMRVVGRRYVGSFNAH